MTPSASKNASWQARPAHSARSGAGATARVDGEEVPQAALGLPRIVYLGEHSVLVRAEGYREAKSTVKVGEGEQTHGHRDARADPREGPREAAHPGPWADHAERPVVPIVLLASGAVALASGLTVGLIGVQRASDAPVQDGPEAAQARGLALAGDIVGSVGVLAAGAGLAMLLLGKPQDKPADPFRGVSVKPFVSPTGIGLVGRF